MQTFLNNHERKNKEACEREMNTLRTQAAVVILRQEERRKLEAAEGSRRGMDYGSEELERAVYARCAVILDRYRMFCELGGLEELSEDERARVQAVVGAAREIVGAKDLSASV